MLLSTLIAPALSEPALHIPDGFLSVLVAAVCWLLSIFFIGLALRRVGRDFGERELPLMGVLAAAVFAGQMLNFPVASGTSGHLLGAALVTILLGPWASILVMACVVIVQALVFQDGGLLAMGANIFNMAVVGTLVAYPCYRAFCNIARGNKWGMMVGGAVAAWGSVFFAAQFTAAQLSLSGRGMSSVMLRAMGDVHILIGIGEALITVGALAFLLKARPELLSSENRQAADDRPYWTALPVILALLVLSPLASSSPDGLEWVAERLGFSGLAQSPAFEIIPDYALPGIAHTGIATILAGGIGAGLLLGAFLLSARMRRRRQNG